MTAPLEEIGKIIFILWSFPVLIVILYFDILRLIKSSEWKTKDFYYVQIFEVK